MLGLLKGLPSANTGKPRWQMGIFSRFISPKRKATSAGGSAYPRDRQVPTRQEQRFAGIEIVPSRTTCCKAASQLSGQRFLVGTAPRLPLPNCDSQQCKCIYRRLEDRRTDVRRDTDVGIGTLRIHYPGSRRAGSPGRRANDKAR
jgi:hypothetical protein